jgi:hypothetical protein
MAALNTVGTGGGGSPSPVLQFLGDLDAASIHYEPSSVRPGALMVSVVVPGERWEIEFGESSSVVIEIFRSDGNIFDQSKFAELFRRFTDEPSEDHVTTP